MNAIAIVLIVTCAWIVDAPLAVAVKDMSPGPCWYLDTTTTPPSWRLAPKCNAQSQSSNGP